ncbi:MAG: methyltransferase [Bacteroidia bacterium]|nr:methyltransferase [Bacteroidia bacterium]
MKVGTDGVLLGSWVDPENSTSLLDIGTGTGLIALMMAQKCSAVIDAVEIHADAYEQAQQNALMSDWADRIRVFHQSFQKFAQRSKSKYDLIISNPPYFNCPAPKQELSREVARHLNAALSMDELLIGINYVLSENGSFNLILPVLEGQVFLEKAMTYNLYCDRRCSIHTTSTKEAKRWMMRFVKQECIIQEEQLVIQYADRSFTPEYVALTSEYYLGLNKFRN